MTKERAPVAVRADARRNIAAILEAATTCLARDPDASINDIAAAAGVGRMTLYGHFDSRAVLVATVAERAIASSEAELGSVDLTGDPAAVLTRLLIASWRLTHRFGALVVAAETSLPPDTLRDAHEEPIKRVRTILRRGRREGCFRTDVPLEWQVTTIQSILHGASAAVHRGEFSATLAPTLVVKTVLGALAAQQP
jgi:TetR/AcrR family transcriptional regulator, mexCD-oprJ operon repressor